MKCPHCQVAFHFNRQGPPVGQDVDGYWVFIHDTCPTCNRMVIYLDRYEGDIRNPTSHESILVRPRIASRPPAPKEVPDDFAQDYNEACLVLADSPKASAALSRRCLQNVLREKAGTTERDLAKQIQSVLDSEKLPTYLADDLDAVRNIGNFAAHPVKSQTTGAVLPVEPGEAEWNLDVVEALFDFYFVGAARAQARRDALNQKLNDAGKGPMKSSNP